MKKNNLIAKWLTVTLIFISVLLVSGTLYINKNFSQNLDEMIYYLFNGMEGTSDDVFITAIKSSALLFIAVLFLLLAPVTGFKRRVHVVEIVFFKKKFNVSLFPNQLLCKHRVIYASSIFTLASIVSYNLLGIDNYIKRANTYSSFIEEHYVDGSGLSISFPDEKRNLIILYLESVENSLVNAKYGGGWGYSVMPELEQVAMNHINFSDSNQVGGAVPILGAGWTVAALVATTTGLPLKIPIDGNEYASSDNFLAGAYSLGDVLKNEGYNLMFMVGSEAGFGGRSNYYTKHGNYQIFDVNTAIQEGKMQENERVWWGFDDSNLFKWAKEEIAELASFDSPFSFSFLTVNTHFPDGYLESGAEQNFGNQYENVHAHTSKQVADFINWLQEQKFYDDTTLVIVGDHLSMQDSEFYNSHIYDGYQRTIYNAFINSTIQPVNSKNRIFTSLDMFPTILASVGAQIEGERLGLGTNLFSTRKTLVEEMDLSFVETELAQNSNFYNRVILQGDYLNLLDQANSE